MQSPRELGLPFPGWRPGQRLALRSILHTKTTHTVINAPTGAGKSTIAGALPRLRPRRRHVTLTATKALQTQYTNSLSFLTDLRGMNNYECRAAYGEHRAYFTRRKGFIGADEGACHASVSCALKDDGCDYFDARRSFVNANAGLTNYATWLSNRRWGASTSPLGQADTLVCDEAHALPEQLMSAFGLDVPLHLMDSRRIPTTVRGWRNWATGKLLELAPGSDEDSRLRRDRTERMLRQLAQMDRAWAWDRDNDKHMIHFEPTIPRLLMPLLHTDDGQSKVVYLSATIMPRTLDLLDIDPDDVTFITMKSQFPIDRRPVYVVPGARVDFRTMDDDYHVGRWCDAIEQICSDRDDRRGLIHSVSFDRAWRVFEGLSRETQRRCIIHKRGMSATDAVIAFRQAGPSAILISPSITTGFDFKYTDAEFQVIVKLPFPDTRSNIMRARVKATPRYREHYTMTTLEQACGRINRAEDDSGETFIVDMHFNWWYRANRDLAADWFDDAIIYTRRRVIPLPKLEAA